MSTNSSGPKNFKTMKFPPSRGSNAIYAQLPKSGPVNVISASQLSQQDLQFKEMKKLLNSEHCPLCSGQLEGPIRFDETELYCVHCGAGKYKACYRYGLNVPYKSTTTYYTTNFAYQVYSYLLDEVSVKYKNIIYSLDLTYTEKTRNASRKEISSWEGNRLILDPNLDERKIIEKIKLYTVFS
jgi:hypothetical protein